MEETFINFLKILKAYDEFINNLEVQEEFSSLEQLFNNSNVYDWINDAFWWDKTPEGYEYWESLDNFWYDILND